MPKIILDQFKGLGTGDRNLPNGQFYAGQDIDLYRDYGYLTPGFLKSDITITGQNQDIIDIVVGNSTNGPAYSYLFGNNQRVYCILNSNDTIVGSFGGATNYATITGATEGKGICLYSATDSAWRIYYFWNTDIAMGVANSNDWSGANLDVDWGSNIPTGHKGLNQGRKDVIEFNSYAYFTNGYYVGKLDASVSPAVLTPEAFYLGKNWAANRLFKTDNYIGIFATEGVNTAGSQYPLASSANNRCRIYLWDGVSSNPSKIVELPGVNQVFACVNKNGNVFAFVDGGTAGHYWTVLQSNGSEYYLEKVKELKADISGTYTGLQSPHGNAAIAQYKGNILFGTYNKGLIMSVGRNSTEESFQLTCPYSCSTATNSRVTAIRQISTDKLYAGYYDGTNYCLTKFSTGYAASAYKGGYIDFGQKVRVNYVKYYFKPLVTGDSVTVGLDIDYGTSVVLKDGADASTISFTGDGAITNKKFMVGRDCHAVRPTLNWTAGGSSFSKIVIDYTFIND